MQVRRRSLWIRAEMEAGMAGAWGGHPLPPPTPTAAEPPASHPLPPYPKSAECTLPTPTAGTQIVVD